MKSSTCVALTYWTHLIFQSDHDNLIANQLFNPEIIILLLAVTIIATLISSEISIERLNIADQ